MKVLIAAAYIYQKEWTEFTRNQTGFGMMVNDIFESVSAETDTYLLTQVITEGHDKILRHTWSDVFRDAGFKDWIRGAKYFFSYKQNFKNRCKYFYYGLNAGTLRRAIRELRPDVVHIHGLGVQVLPFLHVCEDEHIPFLVTLHGLVGLDESVKAPEWDKELERDFLIEAEKKNIPVTVISTGMKRRIEENYIHHEAANITVVCNGTRIPLRKECVQPEDTLDLREDFKLGDSEKIVTVIGSLCERKNQVQIVRAFATGRITTPCQVFFCGGDSTGGAVQKCIDENGLSEKIHLLGFLPQEKISRILDQADLNVVASRDEGFGLSIIEAYSHGVPTVTFADLDAIPDLYDERAMMTVEARDDESFAEAIEASLKKSWDKEWIEEYSKGFSLGNMAEQYRRVYYEVGACPLIR